MLYGNKALQTLYLFNGLFVTAGAMLAPLYALFAESLNVTLLGVSLLSAVFLGSRFICMLLIQIFGDSVYEKEYMLLAGFLIRSIGWFSLALATEPLILFIIQALLGAGEALGSPYFNAIFAKHLDDGKQIAEYSSWEIISTCGAIFGTLLGGYIVSVFGFQSLFVIMGCMALISFVGILLKPRDLL